MANAPVERHVFVCTQEKPEGIPSCAAQGGKERFEQLQAEVARAGLGERVQVTTCGCVGLCERGVNVLVQPDGRWYTQLTEGEVAPLVAEHLAAGRPLEGRADPPAETLRAEIAAHRRKVQGMQAAARQAGMLPPELEGLLRGFQPARVVLTAVELDVFSAVAAAGREGGGAATEDVADRVGCDARATGMLLNALVALGLLTKAAGRFRNGPWAETFLRAGAPHDTRAAIGHSINLWQRWSQLTDVVRLGTSPAWQEMAERGPGWTVAFIAAMHKIGSFRAPQTVALLDLTDVRRVLDLGGGSGAYSIAFARARADLHATVFDLPTVTPLTRRYAAEAGLADRVHTVDGDLRTDDYGADYDLVYVSAIAHMLSPAENRALLRKARAALRPGGRVVVSDFVLDEDRTSPRHAALFAINMLVGTQAGDSYRGSEYRAWFEAAGLRDVHIQPVPGPTALVIGTA
jgi:(2Fe-2S) ferredoxin/SAM-dependent methyltransferase